MSWFSLAIEQKRVLDSQGYVHAAITGSFFTDVFVDKALNARPAQHIKKTTSSLVAKKLAPLLVPISREISNKILSRVVKHKKFTDLFPDMFNRFHMLAIGNEKDCVKQEIHNHCQPILSQSATQQLVHVLFDNYVAHDAAVLTEALKTSLTNKEAFFEFIEQSIAASLRPVSEHALHSSLLSLVRNTTEQIYDNAMSRVLTITTTTLIYSLAIKSLAFLSECYDNRYSRGFDAIAFYLPFTSTFLWMSTAFQITRLFWKSRIMTAHRSKECDKEEIKKLAYKIAKEPVSHALYKNHLFSMLKIECDANKIEGLVTLLIEEAIDFYWKDLREIKFLHLPLVS